MNYHVDAVTNSGSSLTCSLMRAARRAIGSVAERVAAWSDDGGPWRTVHDPRTLVTSRRRRSPVRFEDIDKFMALHAMIERRMRPFRECSDSSGILRDTSFNPDELPERRRETIQSWIEEVARGSRKDQWIRMSGVGRSDSYRWFIDLSGHATSVGISGANDRDSMAKLLGLLEEAVELNTTPARRRNRVVIESVRAPEATQQRHEAWLAGRINRAGMLWGGLAGIIGGGAVQVVVALVD